MPKVWNKRDPNTPKDAVYVGRPSKWGNPFKIGGPVPGLPGVKMDRQMAVAEFQNMLEDPANSALVQSIKKELKGKDLVCWCAPALCHASILLEIANKE
ncbi:MAG TPA: DUF4326 domain-containing protein [Anaerovoracaceae bacterium]|nr:DUF4326 domain-containing protein [Anaerovoracaceae bacterium]